MVKFNDKERSNIVAFLTNKFLIFSLIILITEAVIWDLAVWQQNRVKEKQQLIIQVETSLQQKPVLFKPSLAIRSLQKVSLEGVFDYSRTYYLENITHNNRRGRKVIIPFITFTGEEILISMGWIEDNKKITKQIQPMKITGILREFPTRDGWLQGPIEGITENSLMFFASSAVAINKRFKRAGLWLELSTTVHPEIHNFSDIRPLLTPQRHQQYMFTWYALFMILLGMYIYYFITSWRKYSSVHTD
jgi:cytochrome oxidase assembly protein ShyY1